MNIVAERRKHATEHESAELQRRLIADQTGGHQQIPTLFPWTRIDVADTALCREHNTSWNDPLREAIVHDISKLYVRLMKQMNVLNAHSIIHNAANITRLHGQLLVEVHHKIDVPRILLRVKAASKSERDTATSHQSTSLEFPRRKYTSAVLHTTTSAAAASTSTSLFPLSPSKPPTLPSSASQPYVASPKKFLHVPRHAYHSSRTAVDAVTPLCHQLKDADGDPDGGAVTHFRDRPILADATFDISAPMPKRDGTSRLPKARYLMRENCSALPHQHTIFDDYIIPREVWDAVESETAQPKAAARQQHRFDPIALDDIHSCYYARACPRERDTLSTALHAMTLRTEKPMVRNVTDMVLDSQFHEKNNTLLGREVKMLYMATNEAYHEFRQQLHQPMKVAELVDMAIKCALNDMTMNMDDAIVSTEAMARNSHTHHPFIFNPHGKFKTSRRDLMELMHDFDADKRLVGLWSQRRGDDGSPNRPFEPMALDPLLSVRFENVWRGLLMPTAIRLDLALKYSHPDHAHRLPDAVLLWEVCAAWIQEREGMLDQVKKLLKGGDPTRMALNDAKEKLVVLTGVTKKVKQCISLAHDEVGDFVRPYIV
ncbi:hypothetical protein DYB25_000538 [Aphanomyces astaci]|uniref:Uncharacterized protein n=1 Tax=Aphanomyces astaci TaxID=112090 RepID=A0A397ARE3_APHAT|nr:hypothetical protein DYB36_001159 [Aphanomyces astaci]RHY16498.1 hypothetical protein DYB25_000538 [Aphanomyces astaci]RHY57764.1 hypothetical protein DYB30_001605 [Aphanomyces astaci]RHY58012.1 hypothetical protein DYB38_001349 [Aphanomyces astaci]RHZ22161.1 hypothetical protein DYB26_000584 [Aphanomyces astaci]